MPGPFWEEVEEEEEEEKGHKYKATPRSLRSHSLPRLHAPSSLPPSLAPVLGPGPRLHAMLREVLVSIQQASPPPPASFPSPLLPHFF